MDTPLLGKRRGRYETVGVAVIIILGILNIILNYLGKGKQKNQ